MRKIERYKERDSMKHSREWVNNVCPRSFDPYNIVSYQMNLVKTSWTDSRESRELNIVWLKRMVEKTDTLKR